MLCVKLLPPDHGVGTSGELRTVSGFHPDRQQFSIQIDNSVSMHVHRSSV